jgi:hypothetical protein
MVRCGKEHPPLSLATTEQPFATILEIMVQSVKEVKRSTSSSKERIDAQTSMLDLRREGQFADADIVIPYCG